MNVSDGSKGKWIIFINNKGTTTSENIYFRCVVRRKDRALMTIEEIKNIKVQLEEGSQVTSYEHYKEDKKDILLQDSGFDEGLRGLSNAQDELNDTREVAVKRIEKYTFTGNENFLKGDVKNNTILFIMPNGGKNIEAKHSTNILSNNFIKCMTNAINEVDYECILIGNDINIKINKSKLTTPDVEGFKAWLKTNPTTIYYELAESVVIPFVENISMKTFGERTYVSFENNISGTSSFKVPVNTNKLINDLKFEKEELKEKFNNLTNEFENFKTLMIQTLPYKEV